MQAVPVIFDESTHVMCKQEVFLSNSSNKSRLTKLIQKYLVSSGVEVTICENDADTTIVRTAITKYESRGDGMEVIIVGEDIDLLVLMTALTSEQKINFLKPSHGKVESRLYYSEELRFLRDDILFIHAFSGCGTTCLLYTSPSPRDRTRSRMPSSA